MKTLNILFLILLFSTTSFAEDWVSPTDKEYQKRNPVLFIKFDQARSILDSWRGEKSKLKEAHALLEGILEKDNDYAPAYREYGRLLMMFGYVNRGQFRPGVLGSVESTIKHAIKLSPKYADAYVLLGHVYTTQKEFAKAKKALIMAEKIGTKTPWLNNNWASYYMKVGNYKSAIERFEMVVESKTNNRKAMSGAIGQLGKIYSRLNNKDKTLELYEKSVEFEPESAWAWGNFASLLLFKFGEVDEAIIKGEKALSLMNYGLGRLTLASAYCTKWAMTKNKSPVESKVYLEKTLIVVSDVDAIIDNTNRNRYTQGCSNALKKYKS